MIEHRSLDGWLCAGCGAPWPCPPPPGHTAREAGPHDIVVVYGIIPHGTVDLYVIGVPGEQLAEVWRGPDRLIPRPQRIGRIGILGGQTPRVWSVHPDRWLYKVELLEQRVRALVDGVLAAGRG